MPARALGLPVLYVETRSPLATDDKASLGTRAGYWWLRTDTGRWWICRDATNGAAVWDQMLRPGAAPLDALRSIDVGTGAFADAAALAGKLIVTQNSNYQITPQDSGKVLRATSGAPTFTLPAYADVGPFFAVTAKARGTTITVARAGTNTVDGGTTVSITTGLSRTFGRADTAGEMESY